MSKKSTEKLLAFFKALGEPNRLAIFNHLCGCRRPESVGEVSSCCDVDLSVVSRHLGHLKKAGVLSAEKEGKQVFYSLNTAEIAQSLRDLADKIENCCPPKGCGPSVRRKK
ncbi:MAG: helix-turn-helix transcriptional regulator [Halobacteriovoraceae bacterium]|jgi:ArsR family transcriptional regulator, arsenate/arsenite/antimonite-responsive transcriptional repressor|nr:helix-turn-helix transcriptional regulator [Halobacteriovoraceae bacterium]MBT5095373.1 helix-turn-helix transcriptional regulator [Halobacteriovoraceae bacterium]